MKLTTEERNLLFNLKAGGNMYVSAWEAKMAESLSDRGLTKIWITVGGFPAWAITDEGRIALKSD